MSQNALSRNVEESFEKFPDADPEAYDFQNLISFSSGELSIRVNGGLEPAGGITSVR